jgi:hypothetical protein
MLFLVCIPSERCIVSFANAQHARQRTKAHTSELAYGYLFGCRTQKKKREMHASTSYFTAGIPTQSPRNHNMRYCEVTV